MQFDYPVISEITAGLTGFYRIEHEAYHRGLGISSTKVKQALKGFEKYMQPIRDSAALAFGRAFHCALLEPDVFSEKYRAISLASRRSAAWDNYAEECKKSGFIPLLSDELKRIFGMIGTVKRHPSYQVPGSDVEIMAITRCPDTSLQIKCKADLFRESIVDFKSTSGETGPAFKRDILNYGYHISAAFYQDIIYLETGVRMPFILVPVTKKEPYECEFWQLSDDYLAEGRKLYKGGLKRIANWQKTSDSDRILGEKKLRTMHMSGRAAFLTKEILEFIQ